MINGIKGGFEIDGKHVEIAAVKFGIFEDACKELELSGRVAVCTEALLCVI